MKPPFSYYGGKQTLSKRIVDLIPQHEIYVEPFAGSASVLFAKAEETSKREILNDVDFAVTNFFELLSAGGWKADELIDRLECTQYSEAQFKKAKRVLDVFKTQQPYNKETYDRLDYAWAFYVATSQGFGKNRKAGWQQARAANERLGHRWKSRVSALPEFVERLRAVEVTYKDALEVIEFYDATESFLYLDPPYPGYQQGPYRGWRQRDEDALIEQLKSLKGKFILSGYEYPGAPDDWVMLDLGKQQTASNGRRINKHTEKLWANFEIKKAGV